MPLVEQVSEVAASSGEIEALLAQPGWAARLTVPWERAPLVGGRPGQLLPAVRVEADGPARARLVQRVEYAAPRFGEARLRRRVAAELDYRGAIVAGDLSRHLVLPRAPLTVAISGASGLIGTALAAFLAGGGHVVRRLVRRAAEREDEIAWDPAARTIDAARLDGVDAVVHLAGAGVDDGRWTAARKRELLDSRVDGTTTIARALASLPRKPAVLVSASAVGWYGAQPGLVDESAAPGDDFLAEVCKEWEAAADPARAAGIRVVHPRIGVVLTPAGGVLAKMLPPFRIGLGATVGDGSAPVAWVSLDDTLAALHFAILRGDLEGALNVTAPEPVTQAGLSAAIARQLHRPAALKVPAFALRLAAGEIADSALRGSRVLPRRLLDAGFTFLQPSLPAALAHTLR